MQVAGQDSSRSTSPSGSSGGDPWVPRQVSVGTSLTPEEVEFYPTLFIFIEKRISAVGVALLHVY